MLEGIIGFVVGITVAYIVYRIYRPQWVELGRIQTYMYYCEGRLELTSYGCLKCYTNTRTTYTYAGGSLTKFLVKHLSKNFEIHKAEEPDYED